MKDKLHLNHNRAAQQRQLRHLHRQRHSSQPVREPPTAGLFPFDPTNPPPATPPTKAIAVPRGIESPRPHAYFRFLLDTVPARKRSPSSPST